MWRENQGDSGELSTSRIASKIAFVNKYTTFCVQIQYVSDAHNATYFVEKWYKMNMGVEAQYTKYKVRSKSSKVMIATLTKKPSYFTIHQG